MDEQDAETKPEAQVASRANIFAAMAKARGLYPEIRKNRVATVKHEKGQYSYKYADLSDVFNAIDPILSSNGLTVMQYPEGNNLTTVVGHESGEQVMVQWPIKAMKGGDTGNAQGFQGAVQVAKRYALTAVFGISTEETVEGDSSRKFTATDPMNDKFETGDGVRMPAGAKFTKDMTPRQKAEEAARAISEQFNLVKTGKGLSGAWDRNSPFIDVLAEKHDDLYQNVLDQFQTRMDSYSGDVAGEAPE